MRILIVEDEPVIARRIERLAREILGSRLTYVHAIRTLDDARTHLFATPIDVLFLDLNLNGRDGFDLLQTSVSGAFHVIIVSAHTDQALRAFEFGVLDFIGKPFSRERLAKALHRFLDAHAKADYAARYLSVRKAGRIDLIAIDDVLYVKGAGSYSEIHLSNGAVELRDKSLDRLHALLPPAFERIHKSYIVAMPAVSRLLVHEGSRYEVELHTGLRLPVGRTRYKQIRKKLKV
jgi:two-component system response regulator LytT